VILAKAGEAPLVVATSDAGLYPWQARVRDELVARRPGVVRVATGLPEEGALCSYGRGRVNLRAVAEVLVGAR
jgi:beta-N-acetylhexosaminidase